MSSTTPTRPKGVRSIIERLYSSDSKNRSFIGVWMFPGARALTRTPAGASSIASDFVISSTAPFEAQYAVELGKPTRPAIDEMKMTAPSGRRCGNAAFVNA